MFNGRKDATVTFNKAMAVVVAQLAERSLSIPEVCGSYPVIGIIS